LGAAAPDRLRCQPNRSDDQKRDAINRRDRDDEPVREIARSYIVSHSAISRLTATPPTLQ
jgi:hypothetical protein